MTRCKVGKILPVRNYDKQSTQVSGTGDHYPSITVWEMKASHGFLNTALPFVFQVLIFFAAQRQIGDKIGGSFFECECDLRHQTEALRGVQNFLQAKYAFLRPTVCVVHKATVGGT